MMDTQQFSEGPRRAPGPDIPACLRRPPYPSDASSAMLVSARSICDNESTARSRVEMLGQVHAGARRPSTRIRVDSTGSPNVWAIGCATPVTISTTLHKRAGERQRALIEGCTRVIGRHDLEFFAGDSDV